jgi:cell division protein FtsN
MRDLRKIKECIVIKLDKSQLAVALLGTILVTTGTFAAGVMVGRDLTPETREYLEETLPLEFGDGRTNAGRDGGAPLLTHIGGGTRDLHNQLAQNSVPVTSPDPTVAARIETQRQIAEAIARPTVRSLGPIPLAHAGERAPTEQTLTWLKREPDSAAQGKQQTRAKVATHYTLQIAAFRSAPPANAVERQLRTSGYKSRIRELVDAQGRSFWRVEVGEFGTPRDAERFRHDFERREGYPTLLVPVR